MCKDLHATHHVAPIWRELANSGYSLGSAVAGSTIAADVDASSDEV